MSINVTELNDFTIRNHNGSLITINIEDLRFIQSQANVASGKSFYQRDTNLRFVYLSTSQLLVLDESSPLLKKLTSSYNISLATPPLVDFDFGLAFTKKDVTPTPAAIKLRDALQVIGYNGPIVSDLNTINMYIIILPVTEALIKPAASFMLNVDLGPEALVPDVARPIPVNTTTLAHPDILIGDSVRGTYIKTPGWYIFTGAWCVKQNSGYQIPIRKVNGGEVDRHIRHNVGQKICDENIPNCF